MDSRTRSSKSGRIWLSDLVRFDILKSFLLSSSRTPHSWAFSLFASFAGSSLSFRHKHVPVPGWVPGTLLFSVHPYLVSDLIQSHGKYRLLLKIISLAWAFLLNSRPLHPIHISTLKSTRHFNLNMLYKGLLIVLPDLVSKSATSQQKTSPCYQ